MSRRILVTSALPYANGSLHIGHLVEYVQADIWVRFQKLRGNRCVHICADDAHGTPTMLRARAEGCEPRELIDRMLVEHRADVADFGIGFDLFYTTHSRENRELSELIYKRLRDAGHVARREIVQMYDEEAGMFLPDRFVRGSCPRCGAADQYGDFCEVCGATYSPSDLSDPVSAISGEPPVERESEHLFFRLEHFAEMLRDWTSGDRIQPEVRNKLREWFETGLRDWDISRDAPYWGFEIPDEPGKYFYVWLDAPIGYMSSFSHWCAREGEDFDAWWRPDSDAEVVHFIGKDIAYFHTLFWPAMLEGAGYRTPSAVWAHGFLTVDGEKMSKSRGTFVSARTYLEHFSPEYLRYYYAAKLGSGLEDIDLNLDDFVLRTNSDLVGKLVNIASRCAGFVAKGFAGRLSDELPDPGLYAEFAAAGDEIAGHYESREYARAVRAVAALADRANRYIDAEKPWALAKDEATRDRVQGVCTQGLNFFRALVAWLKPVLPRTAERSEEFLACGPLDWDSPREPLLGREIRKFEPLLQRIRREQVDAMIEASRE